MKIIKRKNLYDDLKKYSISETSKLVGISEKTLRYYDEIGLFKPLLRNNENNYRYYTIKQFYQVENFSFAKEMGIPLKHYTDILLKEDELESGDLSATMNIWGGLIEQKRTQIRQLTAQIELLEFFKANAERVQRYYKTGIPYTVHLPEMYVMAIPHDPQMSFENTSMITRSTIRRAPFKGNTTYKFGVLLDASFLRAGRHVISNQYCVLSKPVDDPRVFRVPDGDYKTVVCRAWVDEDVTLLSRMAEDMNPDFPYVLAEEFAPFEETELIQHQVFFRI